jgi:hypothetical protein
MHYGSTTKATNLKKPSVGVKLIRFLLWFIPCASPDHEAHYPEVKCWFLETDDEGRPQREIGLDQNGKPLFAAPDSRNTGFWTDSAYPFQKNELTSISLETFEDAWTAVADERQP